MKCYSDSSSVSGDTLIALTQKEGLMLMDIVSSAVEANKRKRTWKKFLTQLEKELCCYKV